MEKQIMSHVLQSGQVVTAKAYNLSQLSAKYQIWARQAHGVADKVSLACFIANMPDRHLTYFESSKEVQRLADDGFALTAGEIPDLSSIGEDTPLCFTVLTLR